MNNPQPVLERVTTIGTGGKRFWMYPAAFHGLWLKRRRLTAYVLIIVFFVVPWTKVGGHQTFLMDLTERKFALFGMVFWPQDTLIFWFFLVGSVLAVFFITAQWGRLWCGWACPQTVFLEHVFRKIESLIEGDAPKRRRLDRGPWTRAKLAKKSLKYLIFLIISSHFANTVLCYFASTDKVMAMTFANPGNHWGWFTFMALFNFLFFMNFAWFREQFCIIACPYGRFQSVLLDRDSLIVGYHRERGEPRGVLRKNSPRVGRGDCIDCGRCVAVCPTGIDIRMGLQMECINCTACMDACDQVMAKIGKPKKLIGYTSQARLEGGKRRFLRFRTLAYSGLTLALWGMGTYLLLNKQPLHIQFLRPSGSSFTLLADTEMVTNHFTARATNASDQTWELVPRVPPGFEVIAAFDPWIIPPQSTAQNQVFIRRKRDAFPHTGKQIVRIKFTHHNTLAFDSPVTLLGPSL